MRKSRSRPGEKGPHKATERAEDRTGKTAAGAEAAGDAASFAPAGKSDGEKPAERETRIGKLEELYKELQEKKEHLEDRLLRMAAEFDNYRKRTTREFQQVVDSANRDLILQLIDVLDNFQRALDSAKSAKDFDSFHKGVELIYAHLDEILTRQGLEPIEAVGRPFDPHVHEAVMQIDDDEHPPETVVDQMQPGYLLRDKLLRAPRVVVSREPEGAETAPRGAEAVAGSAGPERSGPETTASSKKAGKENGPSAEKDRISEESSSKGAG